MAEDQCSICLATFKEPKGLPCLHTFCRECLQMYIDSNKSKSNMPHFDCPMCRNRTKPANPSIPRKEWAKSFPTNNYVLKLNLGQKRCPDHPDQALEISCKTCKIIICCQCCLSTHEKCEKTLTGASAKKIRNNLFTYLQDIKVKLEPLGNRLDELERKKECTEKHVKQMTQELLDFIDEQKKYWLQEIEAAYLRESGSLQTQKKKLVEITEMVEENITDINSFVSEEDVEDGPQSLITYDYKPKNTLMTMKTDLVELTEAKSEYQINENFVKVKDELLKERILYECENMETSEIAIGGVDAGASSDVACASSGGDRDNSSIAMDQTEPTLDLSEAATADPIPRPFKFLASVNFSKNQLISINDMVILPDQCFLISEACFKKIWKFSTLGEMIQNITLETEPYGLCILQDQRVAVSLPCNAKIIIFTYSDLKEYDNISFQKKYYSLASDKGERIFALYRDKNVCVDIISKDNPRSSYELFHVIKVPTFLLCTDYRLCVLPSGDILIVTSASDDILTISSEKGLGCIDQNGKKIFVYSGAPNNNLNSIDDYAVGKDFIYVVDKVDHKIHRIHHRGDFVDTPLTSKDGIAAPKKIFINEWGVLAVLSKNKKNNQIQLFSM